MQEIGFPYTFHNQFLEDNHFAIEGYQDSEKKKNIYKKNSDPNKIKIMLVASLCYCVQSVRYFQITSKLKITVEMGHLSISTEITIEF